MLVVRHDPKQKGELETRPQLLFLPEGGPKQQKGLQCASAFVSPSMEKQSVRRVRRGLHPCCSPHLCAGCLFSALHPPSSSSVTLPSTTQTHSPHTSHTHISHNHSSHSQSSQVVSESMTFADACALPKPRASSIDWQHSGSNKG